MPSSSFTARGIPRSLAPFFQEYDLDSLDPDRAAATVIERTLRYGNRAELRWLYNRYPEATIADWVRRWGRFGLPAPHLAFWRLFLGLLDFFSETDEVRPEMHRHALHVLAGFQPSVVEQAWGNLLLVVENLHVGFFGYGYPLVAPPSRAEGVPLASVTDIGLMKLDALATRASRKDFYDVYAVAQRVPLRDLLDLAPTKYPMVRDFEARVVRYMAYFDRAEQEEPPPLLEAVAWSTVKAFFREQAVVLGKKWLE